jgi:hypothetical protein
MRFNILNQIVVVLGILVLAVCLFGDIPEPHKSLYIYVMPIIMVLHYLCVEEIEKSRHTKTL